MSAVAGKDNLLQNDQLA